MDKANCFAVCFQEKFHLPPATVAAAEFLDTGNCFNTHLDRVQIRTRYSIKVLNKLKTSKATGPDGLPARIIRMVATIIALPLTILCRRILQEGIWPEVWKHHNLIPLHKRQSMFNAYNYRCIHLTSTLENSAERIIAAPLLNFFSNHNAYAHASVGVSQASFIHGACDIVDLQLDFQHLQR